MMKLALSMSFLKTNFAPLFFSGEIELGFRAARELGFAGVELSVRNPAELDVESIRRGLKENDLTVTTIATGQSYVDEGLGLCVEDDSLRRAAIARFDKLIDFAARLEAKIIIGGIRGRAGTLGPAKYTEILADSVRRCCDHAYNAGVGIIIEPVNHYEVSCIYTVGEALRFICDLNQPCLSVLYDSYHANLEEKSLLAPILAAKQYLTHVHFADNNRLVPGWGCLDFKEIVAALEALAYPGFICIEALPRPDSMAAARQAITYLKAIA
jgi:sugar phosphate isomerase/epimerase